MKLTADSSLKRNFQPDFRDEILVAMNENRQIKYDIDISESTSDRTTNRGWSKIGELTLNQAIVSYGCDRRLHFAHPKLK